MPHISVLLPTSLVADTQNLEQKTLKIGSVGRALAIFKLRKLLFPQTSTLRYAGLLPPLRTPHHPLRNEKTEVGQHREGVVIKKLQNCSVVEVGLKKKALVEERLEVGTRCTVKISGTTGKFLKGKIVSPSEISQYWGYRVFEAKNLKRGLETVNADFTMGTSRLGSDLYGAIENIKNSGASSLGVVFGGPYAGIFEICKRQGLSPEETFDAIVNTVPGQGTATVRTEEALTATLALLNALMRR